MKILLIVISLFISASSCSQKKFSLFAVEDTVMTSPYSYYILNENRDTLKKLPRDKYYIIFNEKTEKFFIAGVSGHIGWQAIDKDENILFQVYNTSYGEPTPDYFRNGFIRIVDSGGKIGFADSKGNIVIKPQFGYASSFDGKYAVVAMECKLIFDENHKEGDCVHPSMEYKNLGYINSKGKLKLLPGATFEDVSKKIKWKPEEEGMWEYDEN